MTPSRYASLLLLALSLGAYETATALAQGVHPQTGERLFGGFTEAEVEALVPASANPYLALLPPGVEPDYRYWRARIALDSHRRAERRGERASRPHRFSFAEAEGSPGENNTYGNAEHVAGFGTGAGAFSSELTVTGSLTVPSAEFASAGPFPEDDGSIPLASNTGLGVGVGLAAGLIVEGAEIGDGPHGSSTGDFDFYAVEAAESQTIYLQLRGGGGDLHLALYDAGGVLLAIRGVTGSSAIPIVLRAPTSGTYYAAVFGKQEGDMALGGVVPMITDPFDASSGPGPGRTGSYELRLWLTERDVDVFSFDLEAGDILGVGESTGAVSFVEILGPRGQVMMGTGMDFSSAFPDDSPLPSGGNAGGATVAHESGTYAVAVWGDESGDYSFGVHAFRPRTETEPGATQVLFVDFDGATIDVEELFGLGDPAAELSPFAAFVPKWGFEPEEEDELIDRIMAVLEENLRSDLLERSNNSMTSLVLRNSRDHADPGDAPYVSRLIVGGTAEEFGVPVTGASSSIDIGNFGLEDVGVVLLDLLSEPPDGIISLNGIELAPGAEKLDLVATTVGNIAAHEAAHMFGLWHTDLYSPIRTLMDDGGISTGEHMTGSGKDFVFGTEDDIDADFHADPFSLFEFSIGVQDQVNIIAFGLNESASVAAEDVQPEASAVEPLYPNPLGAGGVAVLKVRSARDEHVRVQVYDVAGRLVRTAFDGAVRSGSPQVVRLEAAGLAAGAYLVRVEGAHESATRRLTVVH